MIVWGGYDNDNFLNTVENTIPSNNSWVITNTTDAPEPEIFTHGRLDRQRNDRMGWRR